MTQQTKIEWTDFTVNVAEGCQKVGPGCDNCYAEARDVRFTGGSHWGPGAPRRYVKAGIPKLRKINRGSKKFQAEHGRKPRVFFSSLSDVFDKAWLPEWRTELFSEIELATGIHAQLLTKRVGNVFQMVPPAWVNGGWPSHVGLMITVVNQAEADRDIPKLLDLKAKHGIPWVGLSVEPMLGQIDLTCLSGGKGYWECNALTGEVTDMCRPCSPVEKVDWVICGGESGQNARPMHPQWARDLRDQCEAVGTAFFFKQWGEWVPWEPMSESLWSSQNLRTEDRHVLFPSDFDMSSNWDDGMALIEHGHAAFQRVGKKSAGRLLDGVEHKGVPAQIGGEG